MQQKHIRHHDTSIIISATNMSSWTIDLKPKVPRDEKALNRLYNFQQDYNWSKDHINAYGKLRAHFGEDFFKRTEFQIGETKCPNNHLRIVTISDTHGKHRKLTENNMLPDGDIIIHAGDFTNTGEIKQIKDFCNWFSTLPFQYKIVIAGNHDLTLDPEWYRNDNSWRGLGLRRRNVGDKGIEIIRSCKNLIYLEEDTVEIEGYKFFGSPYQPEFCNWAFNLTRGKKCDDHWVKIPDDTDILITHGPPLGHGDKCKNGFRAGCFDLLRHVQKRVKPIIHIFGHIHEDYGTTTNGTTTFINASSCNYSYMASQKPIVCDIPKKNGDNNNNNNNNSSINSSSNNDNNNNGDENRKESPSIEIKIRKSTTKDFQDILQVINDASIAYKSVVDEYTEPYMPEDELKNDIENAGITFFVAENILNNNEILGVMGIQPREVEDPNSPDVILIRHAYTKTAYQGQGIGRKLLAYCIFYQNERPILIGTWMKGDWAIRFYEKNDFKLIENVEEKNRLLRTYWFCEGLGTLNDPTSEHRKKQMDASVILADKKWFLENEKTQC